MARPWEYTSSLFAKKSKQKYVISFQLLKQERIKDYLLMEEEFIRNQERLKPQEEKIEEERAKVDDLRGTPMSVGR